MKRFKARTALLIVLGMFALSGCVKRLDGSFCRIYKPVFLNYQDDTENTIAQVEENNVVYLELCDDAFSD